MLPELYIGHSIDFVEFILIRFLLLSSSDRSDVNSAFLALNFASSKVSNSKCRPSVNIVNLINCSYTFYLLLQTFYHKLKMKKYNSLIPE